MVCISRFIPTCVGNITGSGAGAPRRPVHPHVCGEHELSPKRSGWGFGSSPRVWGTFVVVIDDDPRRRFIPTCVGNIPLCRAASSMAAVHPHVCGEHIGKSTISIINYGSSPRVWGTSTHQHSQLLSLRFIPTCVGNIKSPTSSISILSVHPHVCGEHYLLSFQH